MNRVGPIEPFTQPGESRALIDAECVPVAHFTPEQAIRVGNWLVAAGQAARGD